MTRLDLRAILAVMGGEITGRDTVNVPGPGHGVADRSLSIKLSGRAREGFVVFSHAGDDHLACRDFVRTKMGWEEKDGPRSHPMRKRPSAAEVCSQETLRKNWALRIWHEAIDPRGTIVETYLRTARCLSLPDRIASSVVRFHGRLRYDGGHCPGMVCLMRSIRTGEPQAIHRTFLNADGSKLNRRMLGIARHAAIRIDNGPDAEGKLAIGEGFETCLAGYLNGFRPIWALASAGAIAAFPVIGAVRSLTLLGENDKASQTAVRACATRYLKMQRAVTVVKPLIGKDLNDVVMACR